MTADLPHTPPTLRRRRHIRAEPLVFASLLLAVTLGINLSATRHAASPEAARPAPAERIAQAH